MCRRCKIILAGPCKADCRNGCIPALDVWWVDWCYLLQVGKGYAGRANKATTKAEAASICQEGFKSVEALYL